MKEIIIIFATVILGVYIGITVINGDSNSLKTGADGIVTNVNTEINKLSSVENGGE